MKAAVVMAAGQRPIYREFATPATTVGLERITVRASALSNASKSLSMGMHYGSEGDFPAVAGIDGVGTTDDGRRVYFIKPEKPYGALAEVALVKADFCVPLPGGLDDVTAAAIANPGVSAWVALVERAKMQPGATVMINGATGSAGRLAVVLARHLGAGKIIATGRNEQELLALRPLGADVTIPFQLENDLDGLKAYESVLTRELGQGVDVVIDYLWGINATTVMVNIAKTAEDERPVRFIHVGTSSGENTIELPGAVLRSSAIELMGSGLKSVPFARMIEAMRQVFDFAVSTGFQLPTRVMPLSAIEEAWQAPGKPRVVISM